MSDHSQSSSPAAAGSPASTTSPSSDKTLVFPPVRDTPTPPIFHNEQLLYTRDRLTPDRWSIESTEALCRQELTAEELFDKLIADGINYRHAPFKPTFEPIQYEPGTKYRKMEIIANENELKRKLASSELTAKQIDEYARNASYYPGAVGSRYNTLRGLDGNFGLITPPRVSLTSSEDEQSPRFLFKELPAKLPKQKIPAPSTPVIIKQNFSESPVSPKRERESSPSTPKTPARRPIADGWKTPTSFSVNNVDHLSPVLNRMWVTERRKFSNSWSPSPLSSAPETSNTRRNLVPFIKKGSVQSANEPDKLIAAFRLKMERTSDSLSDGDD